MAHISLPIETAALPVQTHVRVVPTKTTGQLQIAAPCETSTDILSSGFGIPSRLDTAAVTLDVALQAERDILPLLVRAAVHSIDRAIIERGIAAGWVPSHNSATAGEPKDIDVSAVWLRFRAACARAERTLYGPDDPMWRYLQHRAADSDAEASARERSLETMGRRRVA